jgi:hypothetical protein
LIDDLRQLKPIFFFLQWVCRIVILIVLGGYSSLTSNLLPKYGANIGINTPLTAAMAFLILVFLLFLVWDLLLLCGGDRKLWWRFTKVDGSGLVILLFAYTCYYAHGIYGEGAKLPVALLAVAFVLVICFAFLVGKEIKELKPGAYLERLWHVNQIR